MKVIQRSDYEASKPAQELSVSDETEIRNYEGKNFKEKVREVLNSQEKANVKRALLNYNNSKLVLKNLITFEKILHFFCVNKWVNGKNEQKSVKTKITNLIQLKFFD
jgi:hypothetical protein